MCIRDRRGPKAGSYDYAVYAAAKTSWVVRYAREFPDDPTTPGTWVETPDSYAIGMAPDGTNASGGIALGPDFDAKTGTFNGACDAYLWSTGDALRDNFKSHPAYTRTEEFCALYDLSLIHIWMCIRDRPYAW